MVKKWRHGCLVRFIAIYKCVVNIEMLYNYKLKRFLRDDEQVFATRYLGVCVCVCMSVNMYAHVSMC